MRVRCAGGEFRLNDVLEVKVLPGSPAPHWRYESLMPRMAGRVRWELSIPIRSWSAARDACVEFESETGLPSRVVFVERGGEVVR